MAGRKTINSEVSKKHYTKDELAKKKKSEHLAQKFNSDIPANPPSSWKIKGEAKREYKNVIYPIIQNLDGLGITELESIRWYLNQYQRWLDIKQALDALPIYTINENEQIIPNPLLKKEQDTIKILQSLSRDLGFSFDTRIKLAQSVSQDRKIHNQGDDNDEREYV